MLKWTGKQPTTTYKFSRVQYKDGSEKITLQQRHWELPTRDWHIQPEEIRRLTVWVITY